MGSSSFSLSTTYFTRAAGKVAAIARGLVLDESVLRSTIDVLRQAMMPWGYGTIPFEPLFLSSVCDDHSPFEVSVTFGPQRVELGLLIESQPSNPTIASRWATGMKLLETMRLEFGASLARLSKVEELFRPTDEWGRFAVWLGVRCTEGGPRFTAYLNPAAHGRRLASRTVESALRQLDMSSAWDAVSPLCHDVHSELRSFALDLDDGAHARTIVELAHYDVTDAVLESLVAAAPHAVPGRAAKLRRQLSRGDGSPHVPLYTCHSFAAGSGAQEDIALRVPLGAKTTTDAEVAARVSPLLSPLHANRYGAMVQGFAGEHLERSSGVQTYASTWMRGAGEDITLSLSPQVYRGRGGRRRS